METYLEFLRSKIVLASETGFTLPPEEINPALKPHQRDAVVWALRGGRRALFESFGLGKTVQELEFCHQAVRHEGGKALIVLPLGVRQEFTRDAVELLHYAAPEYITSMAEADSAAGDILMTNYERVRDGDIDPTRFTAVALDEASVLRSFGSKTYQMFLPKFQGVKYKLVSTATPSPNRYKELIHYAGYLEIMDTGQALTRFFQRDSTKANNLTLYPHKEDEFWLWVSSWALFIGKPSDLGYDDTGYALPPLDVRTHIVRGRYGEDADRDGQFKLMHDAAASLAREKAGLDFVSSAGSESGLVDNEHARKMAKEQAGTAALLNTLGKNLGVRIEMVDTISGGKANGVYIGGKNLIRIAADANTAVEYVAAHEVTHRMQELAPEEYRVYRDHAMSYRAKVLGEETTAGIVAEYMADAEAAGVKLTQEEAMDEIAANFTEDMIENGKLFEDFAKENRSAAKKLLDALKAFIAKVKSLFRSKAAQDRAAQDAYGKSMAELEQCVALWQKAYDAAGKQAQKAKTAAREGDGEGRYQIKNIDGRLMTVIDTQNDTRDFKAAEAYLKTLVNTEHPFSTILMDAQPVFVGKDLPGEYKSSEYTKTMKPALRKIKMQAATNLDEMLLLAENGEWRENVKPKHAKDAQNGWYRYDTEFAVPVLDAKKNRRPLYRLRWDASDPQ